MRAPDLTGNGGAGEAGLSDVQGTNQKTTGRHIVVFRQGATKEGVALLSSLGFKVLISNADGIREDQAGDADAIVFSRTESALVAGTAEQTSRLLNEAERTGGPILSAGEEKVRTLIDATIPAEYYGGYRNAFLDLVDRLL